jgi:hypothetical protein
MAIRIQHYRRKVHREANDGTTTRHIAVEEHSDGVYLIVYEVDEQKTNMVPLSVTTSALY